jgi:hypothetical protein
LHPTTRQVLPKELHAAAPPSTEPAAAEHAGLSMSKPASGSPRRHLRHGRLISEARTTSPDGGESTRRAHAQGLTQKKGELLMDQNLFQIEELESRLEMVSVDDISCECTCTCSF